MDSLKGTLISIMLFGIFILPALVDVIAMGIVTSQLNKVGAEMIQVVGSSSSYDERTVTAKELAWDKYKVHVEFSDTDYELGDDVELKLTKKVTRLLPTPGEESEGDEDDYFMIGFSTYEKVLITKREES